MPLPTPLPSPFATGPFATRTAIDAGVSPERLRRRDLHRPYPGTRMPATDERTLDSLCKAYATRMPPDAVFSHITAARLLGMPLPQRFGGDERLHVATPAARRALRAQGVRGHKLDLGASEIVLVRDIPLTSPARTWLDLARGVSVEELIVLGDYLLWRRQPFATPSQMAEAVARATGTRGVANAKLALGELTDRADSPPESQFRYRFSQAGLPAAKPNFEIYSSSGRFLAMPDLVFEEYREVFDYEGDHHRTDEHQWHKDITRVRILEHDGWHSTRGSKADLRDSSELIARLKQTFVSKGWRP